MKPRKTWREKLADNKGLPKTSRIEDPLSKRWGMGTMVVPAPLEVDALMRAVPRGRLVTLNEIRSALAKKHDVTMACPLTTGIFSWIAAHAAAEAVSAGISDTTPYWRTLKAGGEINAKFPGGVEELKQQLIAEGHQVEQRGRKWYVSNYQSALVSLD